MEPQKLLSGKVGSRRLPPFFVQWLLDLGFGYNFSNLDPMCRASSHGTPRETRPGRVSHATLFPLRIRSGLLSCFTTVLETIASLTL